MTYQSKLKTCQCLANKVIRLSDIVTTIAIISIK